MASNEEIRRLNARIRKLMGSQGIRHDDRTGLDYYSAYGDNLYDWEHYFDSIALAYCGAEEYSINGLRICLQRQREDGFICRHIKGTGGGIVGAGDATALPSELAQIGAMWEALEQEEHFKPFLCQFALMISRMRGDAGWLRREEFAQLRRYVDHWLYSCDRDRNGLSVWASSSHSGADTQHERMGTWKSWFCEGVDLNCYLHRECLAAALLADGLGLPDEAEYFRAAAASRKSRIQELLWDEEAGFFFDRNEKTGESIRVRTGASFVPLWAGVASPEQAAILVERHLANPQEFWTPYPVCTFARDQAGYTQYFKPPGDDFVQGLIPDHGNWNGGTWPHWNYMFIHGLARYGYHREARLIADGFLKATSDPQGPFEWHNAETGQGRGVHPFCAGASALGGVVIAELESDFDPMAIGEVGNRLDFAGIRRLLAIEHPFGRH